MAAMTTEMLEKRDLGLLAIRSLEELLAGNGVSGLNIWHCNDDGDNTFTVEVGRNKYSNSDLVLAILKAAGRLPNRECSRCKLSYPLTHFVGRKANTSGYGWLCIFCNRISTPMRAGITFSSNSRKRPG